MEFTDVDFREKILRLAGDLFYIKQYLASLIANPPKESSSGKETVEQSLKLIEQSEELITAAEWHKFFGIMVYVNSIAHSVFRDRHDESDYEKKKSIASEMNAYLRDHEAAISHPDTKEPCLLLAISSRDGHGRYSLENKITKKRSGSHKSIVDLIPLRFVKAMPRKEGFASKKDAYPSKFEDRFSDILFVDK